MTPRRIPQSPRLVCLLLLLGALLLQGSRAATAEPYIAIRTGFKCTQCHVNRTGGGKRTPFGLVYAQTKLNMAFIRRSERGDFLDGRVNEFLSMGADLRVDDVSLFSFETSDGTNTGSSNLSRISEANVYFQMELIDDIFSLYLDQTFAPGSNNREFFGLIQDPDRRGYVKIGRMLLPFGLRLLDNDAFIRNRTGYTYSRHDLGAEIGLEPAFLSAVANITNTQASFVASAVFRRFRVGGSFGRTTKRGDRYVVGAFGGTNVGRLTLLGEVDFINDGDIDRFASLAEFDLLIAQGFNVKGVYEFFDRNTDVDNDRDGQERITLGVEPFVTQFLQIGLFYRINRFIPQNLPGNQDQLTLQFHGFF